MPPIGIGLPPPELEDIQIAEATYSAAMKIVLERDALKKDDRTADFVTEFQRRFVLGSPVGLTKRPPTDWPLKTF